jgi:hypothetical protein
MGSERHNQLREAAAETLRPEEFDRLVASVSDARRLGRLRYWQEQLLDRIPGGEVGFEEFVAAFEGAPLLRPRADASAATVGYAEAWRSNTEWRDDFVSNAARELSKHGELGCHAHVLRELAGSLQRDEVLWLFAQLQQSQCGTLEWRDEFLALFPQVSLSDLPQPLYDEEAARNSRHVILPIPDDIPF